MGKVCLSLSTSRKEREEKPTVPIIYIPDMDRVCPKMKRCHVRNHQIAVERKKNLNSLLVVIIIFLKQFEQGMRH